MSVKKTLVKERLRRDLKRLNRLLKRKFPCAMCKKPIIPATCMVVGGQRLCFKCEVNMPEALPRKRLYVPKEEVEHDQAEQATDDAAADGALVSEPAGAEDDGVEAR